MRRLLTACIVLLAACSAPAQLESTGLEPTTSTSQASSTTTTTTTVAPSTTDATTTTTLSVSIPATPAVVTVLDQFDAATGGVTADAGGNVYFADIGRAPARNGTSVYKLAPSGEVSLLARSSLIKGASGNAVDAHGNLYQSGFTSGTVARITPDGEVERFASVGIVGPIGVVVNPETDGLFVADCQGHKVVSVSADGATETLAKDPLFDCPNGITLDDDGNIYVANFGDGKVLRITPDGTVSELVELPGHNLGHLTHHDGILYVAARGAHKIYVVTLDGEATVLAGSGEREVTDGSLETAAIQLPNGVAVTPDGAVWVNSPATGATANEPVALRRIDPAG